MNERLEMRIKYLIMDVDGTLTDGKIYMSSEGELMKAFNIKDGYGIHDILLLNGVEPVIITGRNSDIVRNRCKELGIKRIYQGITDKEKKIKDIIDDLSKVAYIGDDLNDYLSMKCIKEDGGLIGCPADAVNEIKDLADYISIHNGGNGAVRDFIDWLIRLGDNS